MYLLASLVVKISFELKYLCKGAFSFCASTIFFIFLGTFVHSLLAGFLATSGFLDFSFLFDDTILAGSSGFMVFDDDITFSAIFFLGFCLLLYLVSISNLI
jgi:hypothetical protein